MSTGKSSKRKNQSICENSTLIVAFPVLQRDPPASMRRVVTQSPSTGYVMEPDYGKSVDTSAAEFIRKVRQQNRSDGATAADISDSCIPPPPLNKWATYPR